MKSNLLTLLLVLALTGTADEVKTNLLADLEASVPGRAAEPAAATPAEAEKPAAAPAEAEKPAATPGTEKNPDSVETPVTAVSAAALRQADTDEIDLEENDDTAALAGKPQIKTESETSDFVDISCDEATLADVLRQFRKTTKANIICDDSTNLQKRVSAELKHVPWLTALQSILNSRGFRLEERGNIYFVNEDKSVEPLFTRTFALNHASSKDLAKLFNDTYAKKDAKGVMIPIASYFEGANVVVVTAPDKTIQNCEAIIKAVDKAVTQIYIDARFLEASNEAMHKLGLDWSGLERWGIEAKQLEATLSTSTKRDITDTLNRNHSMLGDLIGNGEASWSRKSDGDGKTSTGSFSSSLSENIKGNSETHGKTGGSTEGSKTSILNSGFSGTLSADRFKLALSAFEQIEDAKVFSNPRVIVSNGKEACVDMTTKFPNVRLTSQRNNSSYGTYLDMSAELSEIPGERGHKEMDYKDKSLFAGSCFYEWGITLMVKPRISPDGLISVEIVPTVSQLDLDSTLTGFYTVANSDTEFGQFPIISMKRITTDFMMKEGSTAVIGGLSKTVEEDVDSGIPYLRKIPWIGQKLFGWTSRQKVQKEIIVCVTVGIANPAELPKDIGLPTNAVIAREYIEGKKLEPGFRAGGAEELTNLDRRPLDDRKKDDDARGTVTITPSAN